MNVREMQLRMDSLVPHTHFRPVPGLLFLGLCLLLTGNISLAKEAAPMIADPVIEARMAAMGGELRCLVCQGQSIAGSDSGFANDVKKEMRTMMENGRSDFEIVDFLVQRYGDFILFRPPVKGATLLLWAGPFILLGIALLVLFISLKRRGLRASEVSLSNEEIRRAESLLGDDKDGKG